LRPDAKRSRIIICDGAELVIAHFGQYLLTHQIVRHHSWHCLPPIFTCSFAPEHKRNGRFAFCAKLSENENGGAQKQCP
jgi:hypothetical protein